MDQASIASHRTLRVRVANMRVTWVCLMGALLRRGLVTTEDVEAIRDSCRDVALELAVSPCGAQREFGATCLADLDGMFDALLGDPISEH